MKSGRCIPRLQVSHKKKLLLCSSYPGFPPATPVGGRHILRLSRSTESRNDLANRLEKIGCKVNRIGRYWMKAGDFAPTEAKPGKKRS